MRAAPKKGDCVVCQAPDAIRVAVNAAIWHEGSIVRTANYRAAGARAASQIAMTLGPDADRYSELDPKTITRHADHIEDSWREVMAGDRLADDEVPVVAHEFGSVMDAGADLGMLSMKGLRELITADPLAFAALRTKEAISIAKLGTVAAGAKETSRLKRNQQKIDVMAIFAASAGFMPSGEGAAADDAAVVVDLRAEIAQERSLLEARNG
jgi:hypothetical protein